MLANVASNHLVSGRDARRFGNGHPNIVPYTAYPASGRHDRASRSATTASSRSSRRCSASPNGRPTCATRGTRSASPTAMRSTRRSRRCLADDSARKTWIAKLARRGIPCGRINSVAQALERSAHDRARDGAHGAASDRRRRENAGHSVPLQRHAGLVRRAPPTLGQHTEQVLARHARAFRSVRIDELRAEKVIIVITGLSHVSIVVPGPRSRGGAARKRCTASTIGEIAGQRAAGRAARLRRARQRPHRADGAFAARFAGREVPRAQSERRHPSLLPGRRQRGYDRADRSRAQGVRVLGDGKPQLNVHGERIAFVHPKDFLGALVELEEHRSEESSVAAQDRAPDRNTS